MKFHVIVTLDEKRILANVYEQPWYYSEYTHGGGTFNTELVEIDDVLGEGKEEFSMVIYPTKEAAEIALNERSYYDVKLKVIPITDLEK